MNANFDDIEVIIDWFQITIFPEKNYADSYQIFHYAAIVDNIVIKLFKELFGLEFNNLTKEQRGFNGYDVRYTYNNIQIMINSNREDMGVNILLSGKGCRDFESLDIGWRELFDKIKEFEFNVNRIDIAIDTFTNKYFTLQSIYNNIKLGLCCSKFKQYMKIQSGMVGENKILGYQIQFGSKTSNIEITFYDKRLERASAGYMVDKNIKYWYRCEIRFRHEFALEIFNNFLQLGYQDYIRGILYNYIDFKIYSKDKNISRRPTATWWLNFVDDVNKVKLFNKSSDTSITKKKIWIDDGTSKSQLMVYIAELDKLRLDNLTNDYLLHVLKEGVEKITDKDINLINDHRIRKKLVPFTKDEIYDYIKSIYEYEYLD